MKIKLFNVLTLGLLAFAKDSNPVDPKFFYEIANQVF